jgi:hypothetical protein
MILPFCVARRFSPCLGFLNKRLHEPDTPFAGVDLRRKIKRHLGAQGTPLFLA